MEQQAQEFCFRFLPRAEFVALREQSHTQKKGGARGKKIIKKNRRVEGALCLQTHSKISQCCEQSRNLRFLVGLRTVGWLSGY